MAVVPRQPVLQGLTGYSTAATAPDFPILVRLDAIKVSAYGNVAHSIAFTEAPLVHEPGPNIAPVLAIVRRARVLHLLQ